MWILLAFKNIAVFIKKHTAIFVFISVALVICTSISMFAAGMVDAVTPKPQNDLSDIDFEKEYLLDFTQGLISMDVVGTLADPETDAFDTDGDVPEFLYTIFDRKTGELLYRGKDYDEAAAIYEPFEKQIDEYQKKHHQAMSLSQLPAICFAQTVPEDISVIPKISDIMGKLYKIQKAAGKYCNYMKISGTTDEDFSMSFLASTSLKIGTGKVNLSMAKYHGGDGLPRKVNVGDKIHIGDNDYIVGKVEVSDEPVRSLVSLDLDSTDDSFIAEYVTFALTDDAPFDVRKRVDELVQKLFSDYSPEVTLPKAQPLIEKQFNNMVYVISFIIIAVIMLNISRLYSYVISLRKKNITVFRLCGAQKLSVYIICFLEIVLLLCVSYALGFLLFHFGIVTALYAVFPTFAGFFTKEIYLNMFLAYCGLGIFILFGNIIPHIRKTVNESGRSVE